MKNDNKIQKHLDGSYDEFIKAYQVVEQTLLRDYERKTKHIDRFDPVLETPAVAYPTMDVVLTATNHFLWFCQQYENRNKELLENSTKGQ
jgi:hypothetical protein